MIKREREGGESKREKEKRVSEEERKIDGDIDT